ncbi:MAG: 3-oxoacyl-[acyl-carrier-protein] reductase [Ignavibacteriaceae bacterium]|nr:3-oxoacyl-[acyl-carrier-protein] reductase [Ignavibacteriaceae bacterium]
MVNQTKTILVTGGTRGIGRAIVKEFAKEGFNIVFTYNASDELAQDLCREIDSSGSKAVAFKADASDMNSAEEVINKTLEKFGRIDILVNNAGITKDTLILRMTGDDFDKVISANLKSTFNYTKFAIKSMINQKWGRIINISSVVALIGNPGQSNYVASKAGMIGFSKSIAKEVATRNITVNVIAPGFIESDMTAKLNEKQKEAILNQIPQRKIGLPEDIARTVKFLSSEDASYITGQVIAVDGGMTM